MIYVDRERQCLPPGRIDTTIVSDVFTMFWVGIPDPSNQADGTKTMPEEVIHFERLDQIKEILGDEGSLTTSNFQQ